MGFWGDPARGRRAHVSFWAEMALFCHTVSPSATPEVFSGGVPPTPVSPTPLLSLWGQVWDMLGGHIDSWGHTWMPEDTQLGDT